MKISNHSKSLTHTRLMGTAIGTRSMMNAEGLDGDSDHESVPGTGIGSSPM